MSDPANAGPPSHGDGPAPGTGGGADGANTGSLLPDKPILEWTEADWARWIASPPRPADDGPPAQAAGEDPGGAAEVAAEERGEPGVQATATESDHAGNGAGSGEAPGPAFAARREQAVPAEGAPAGAEEREWWEQSPPPPERDVRPDAAPTRSVTGLTAPMPPVAPPRPAGPAAATRSPGRTPSRGAPATGVRPTPPRAQPVVIEQTHRVRSALGLLGVAVLVGTIVAGLITVALFAVSVALRRAVG